MKFRPICRVARVCGVCGLAFAVLVGEEHEHTHVEVDASPTFWRADNIPVATTSSALSVMSSLRPPAG